MQEHPFNINSFSWTTLAGKHQSQNPVPINEFSICDEPKHKQVQIDKIKEDFNFELRKQQTKYQNDYCIFTLLFLIISSDCNTKV
jgi:hypothetical protein